MAVERFGFLSHRSPIVFNGGAIEPLPDIELEWQRAEATKHPHDGHWYPPPSVTVKMEWNGTELVPGEEVPHSSRPALMWPLPPTHTVSVDSPLEQDFKRGDGAFLIYLAAYLFACRVQFEEWEIDGRVPIRPRHVPAAVTASMASKFFAVAYDTWRAWDCDKRQAFTTCLYMHSKAPAYEWPWEQFTVEYMVFDALCELNGIARRHSERPAKVCAHFSLYFETSTEPVAEAIVKLRNRLFHEALWEQDTPGFAITQNGWDSMWQLRQLN